MIKKTTYSEVTRFDLAHALPFGWHYWTTAYLVDGLMIDSGCAHTAQELLAALKGTPPRLLVNTHSHEDHIGANGDLVAHYHPESIYAHPLALRVLADPRRMQPLQPYRRLFWGWPKPSIAEAVIDGFTFMTEHFHFKVVHTPGHSPDHLCLYETERGWLFSGDLFVGGRDRALGAGYNIWQIIASLKRIEGLQPSTLFPGSAQVRFNPGVELASKIAYLEELTGRILNLHQRGWSFGKIMRSVCGPPMQVEFITLGHFSRRHLVRSCLGNVHGE